MDAAFADGGGEVSPVVGFYNAGACHVDGGTLDAYVPAYHPDPATPDGYALDV